MKSRKEKKLLLWLKNPKNKLLIMAEGGSKVRIRDKKEGEIKKWKEEGMTGP